MKNIFLTSLIFFLPCFAFAKPADCLVVKERLIRDFDFLTVEKIDALESTFSRPEYVNHPTDGFGKYDNLFWVQFDGLPEEIKTSLIAYGRSRRFIKNIKKYLGSESKTFLNEIFERFIKRRALDEQEFKAWVEFNLRAVRVLPADEINGCYREIAKINLRATAEKYVNKLFRIDLPT